MRFVCSLQDISFETQTGNKARQLYDLTILAYAVHPILRAVRKQKIEQICLSIVVYNFRQRNEINVLKLVSV